MGDRHQELLQEASFQELITSLASQHEMTRDEVEGLAQQAIKELFADQHPLLLQGGVELAEYVVGRAYSKSIDVSASELKELSRLMRRHSVAFVMTHKTYIDMFVLGIVLARHGLKIPYIFAGINMAFLGLGQLGRRAGTIFIRRSFKEDEVYKTILRYFIARLVEQQEHFMWAIEGTRSRTGKLVWPKMGILKYIQEAEAYAKKEVKYVPISIVYDLIPDVDDMTSEGRGKVKKSESLSWFVQYVQKMGGDFGRISLRVGEPVAYDQLEAAVIPDDEENEKPSISKFAFGLIHGINSITPVTTSSLICTTLLTKFALSKKQIERSIYYLMQIIESKKPDALVDRGKNLGQAIQRALNLLVKANLVRLVGDGLSAKYSIVPENFLRATYYSNMAVHHLYQRAFIEIALLHVAQENPENRMLAFWEKIMALRDLFKFEFFFSAKEVFTEEIEQELRYINPEWEQRLLDPQHSLIDFLGKQEILIANVILNTTVEAYRVVSESLTQLDKNRDYSPEQLMRTCLFLGEEMHWKGNIHRLESVSKPFIKNGLRLVRHRDLIPHKKTRKKQELKDFQAELKGLAKSIQKLQAISDDESQKLKSASVTQVPGSKTSDLIQTIIEGESGPHVAAYFDLDRTLISGFSAKQFVKSRLMSGKMSRKEIAAQFSGAIVYALGNKNFAALAAVSAKGVKDVPEKVLIELGEEVYMKYLADSIYDESRALVQAHMDKGHTVAIVSAATPYQVDPVARDLGIDHIMCTRMEVEKGKFTGDIIEPPCWGEGKAHYGEHFAERHDIDLSKSYFYTDSAEDLPLLDIVGHPRPINPDAELSSLAFQREWPVSRFNDEGRPGFVNILRTGLTAGVVAPAVITGMLSGVQNLSWTEGVNSMAATVGDLGTWLAGLKLLVKGEEHLWSHRPAVFIFNHQSNVDLLIMAKLLRKDAFGIAKKELQYTPVGPILKAAGVIFIDRKNKEKAIEALKPAVEALKNGKSVGIAPEGTRSYDYNLGKFKKGAFHLAMQAGVPIVPIVIKNAHDAMPRGTNFIRPAVVEVKVLPPVSIEGWSKVNLDENIHRVRDMYLKELDQGE